MMQWMNSIDYPIVIGGKPPVRASRRWCRSCSSSPILLSAFGDGVRHARPQPAAAAPPPDLQLGALRELLERQVLRLGRGERTRSSNVEQDARRSSSRAHADARRARLRRRGGRRRARRGDATLRISHDRSLLCSLACSRPAAARGCRGQTSRSRRSSASATCTTSRSTTSRRSDFFPDHRTMRPLVEGIVSARGRKSTRASRRAASTDEIGLRPRRSRTRSSTRSGGMEALVARGQDRYGIYCAPCHDGTGSGKGMVKRRAVAAARRRSRRRRSTRTASGTCPTGSSSRPSRNGMRNMPPYAIADPGRRPLGHRRLRPRAAAQRSPSGTEGKQ